DREECDYSTPHTWPCPLNNPDALHQTIGRAAEFEEWFDICTQRNAARHLRIREIHGPLSLDHRASCPVASCSARTPSAATNPVNRIPMKPITSEIRRVLKRPGTRSP